jgi:acyl-CoA synthetase (AMP-forming)/AMP-acid ligase II
VTPYQRLNPLPDFHEIRYGVLHKKLLSRREFRETRHSDSRTFFMGVNEFVRTLTAHISSTFRVMLATECLHVMLATECLQVMLATECLQVMLATQCLHVMLATECIHVMLATECLHVMFATECLHVMLATECLHVTLLSDCGLRNNKDG